MRSKDRLLLLLRQSSSGCLHLDLTMQQHLIMDLGAHNGDDTAYYLQKGFRVVAVEANPLLAEQVENRFQKEGRRGRLTVLNIGVAGQAGSMSFWVNADNSAWSSFDRQ